MATDEKWVNSNSPDKEEEEEALSLSGLPVNEDENQSISKGEDDAHQPKEEFNFNSSGGSALAESEMCAADEVFFQGQILPFRHSVSFETGFAMFRADSRSVISRSQSMDHRYSGANFPSGSTTRSSSISSDHNTLSSGSSSSTTKTPLLEHKPPIARTRNQFHSHPSPSPQIRIQRGNSTPHRRQKSTLWSFFQVGLIPTPEIKLPDFKIRSINNISTSRKNFGSRNSTNSTSSTSATSINDNRKKKQWSMLFDRNRALFDGGCRSCSVDQTVHPRINVSIKNCSSSSSSRIGVNCETFGKKEKGDVTNKKNSSMQQQQQQKKGKQALSRNRTFEWLKQLSLEGGPEDESSAAA